MTERTARAGGVKVCSVVLTLLLLIGLPAVVVACGGGGEKAEVQQTLDDFAKALNDKDPAAVAEYFDWRALADQFSAENPETAMFVSAGTSDLAAYMKTAFISEGRKELAEDVAYESDAKTIAVESGVATVTFKGGKVASMKKESGKWLFVDLASLSK